jgi:type III secretion protein D
MDSERLFAVSVLEGSHAGATLALPAGKYRFGRGRDADVVLTDAGLQPLHFSIDLARHGAAVDSMGGGVTLDGRSSASTKSSARLHFPFEIAAEGVRLRVDGPENPSWDQRLLAWYDQGRDWLQRSRRAPVLAALAIIPISLAAFGAGGAPDPTDAAHATAAPAARQTVSVTQAVESLRNRAREAGLQNQLQIDPAGDAIAVRGTLVADQMEAWQGIRQEFDSAFGNGYAFDSQINTVSATARPQLDLQAIWAGAPAYVITSSGDRLKEGDSLTSGWRIDKIERARVTLSQGDQRMILTY